MRLKLTLLTLLAAGLAIPAAMASSVNGTDRTNAARACSSLRASLGPSSFGKLYTSNGACVSAWIAKAHSARLHASATCRHNGLKGRVLASCITAHTRSSLSVSIKSTKNAAKTCASSLATLGPQSFASTWGTGASAFGKCVSSTASGKPAPSTTPPSNNAAQHFTTSLTALNGSGVSGSGTLLLNNDKLTVHLSVTGLETGQSHEVSIRGTPSGNSTCPTSVADSNHDGTISLSEAQPSVGNALVALSPTQQTGEQLSLSSSVLPLTSRTILVLGKTVNGTYDATLPVACGTIAAAT